MSRARYLALVVFVLVLALGAGCVAPPPSPAPVTSPAVPATGAAPTTAAAATPAAPAGTPGGAATGSPNSSAKGTVPTPPADGSRPLAAVPAAERNERFSGPAATFIKPNTIYMATIETAKGNIVAELYQDTPQSANNFVTLAEDGFYDGLTFHRVEPNFVIQGGDPAGSGQGGPGYTIPAEINHKHIRGALAWARTGDQINPQRASSGSQFYITLADTPSLDGAYTVFGQVVQGLDVLDKIAVGDVIKKVDISEGQASQLPTPMPPTPTREPSAPKPEDGRPLAKLPAAQREKLYTMPPAMSIDPTKAYQATITTAKGTIVVDLDAKTAPNTVNNFTVLANLGYYDGMPVAFVRESIFVVLGSPGGNENSDVGYALEPEVPASGSKVITGTVSMYPAPNQQTQKWQASGSQFLLWLDAAPQIDVPLTVFGQVTSGMDIVTKLQQNDKVDKIEVKEK